MIVLPAIDIRDRACVQLVGGRYDDERVRLPDPAGVARRWRRMGFRHLHVVDLDAATGQGENTDAVAGVLAAWDGDAQVGGGVRSEDRVNDLLELGASRVILGTRALEEPEWLAGIARARQGKVVVAVDVRDGAPVVRGWTNRLQADLGDVLATLSPLPLAAILVTAVDVEGQLRGPELGLIDQVLSYSSHPLVAAGGITTMDDLYALRDRGVWAAVIGMAMYAGSLDGERVAAEFGA
ncbi:MAG: 1-(5-phosphoribosyl)-5-[(5-phosphoribosylamino)methylideneamino] imidazole-4-carboxamide isomerase [Gemmatimonadaceae bacterium]|nr:1-(5-phosphoribosyl)-5-[(5-phosphoribosylamino)methylideneamino] imidazole-4-carboxamide isomerase [Gemmatimonadaceae bacterium]